jgi:hypothetical protein
VTALDTVKVGFLPTLGQPTGQVDTVKTDTWTHHSQNGPRQRTRRGDDGGRSDWEIEFFVRDPNPEKSRSATAGRRAVQVDAGKNGHGDTAHPQSPDNVLVAVMHQCRYMVRAPEVVDAVNRISRRS